MKNWLTRRKLGLSRRYRRTSYWTRSTERINRNEMRKRTVFSYIKFRCMHEETWFEPYTWSGEIVTELIIQSKPGYNAQIGKMIEAYFDSLGLSLSGSYLNVGKGAIWTSWHIDMVNKRYSRLTYLENRHYRHLFTAWPSQLKPYLHEKRGTLTGSKFGI